MVTAHHEIHRDPEEHFVLSFRQHWMRIWTKLLRLFLQTLFIVVVGWISFFVIDTGNSNTNHLIAVLLLFGFLVTQFELLLTCYHYFLRITIFTDRKVHQIKKTLLLIDDHHSLDLWMLQDIQKNQHGVLQNMLGYGTLVLDAQDSEIRLHFVPKIRKKADVLLQLRERAREHMAWGGRQPKPVQWQS